MEAQEHQDQLRKAEKIAAHQSAPKEAKEAALSLISYFFRNKGRFTEKQCWYIDSLYRQHVSSKPLKTIDKKGKGKGKGKGKKSRKRDAVR